MVIGSSSKGLKAASQQRRWLVDHAVIAGERDAHHRGDGERWSPRTTGRFSPTPTDRIAPCGWLMIEAKDLTPNMPRLETEKVPPGNSSGFSFLVRGALGQILAQLNGDLSQAP